MKRRKILAIITIILATVLIISCSQASQTDSTTPADAPAITQPETQSETTELVASAPVTDADGSADTGAANSDEIARPEGWSEETHSKSADPNYDVVFPKDEVNRLDITISAQNWAAMMADMTELYGEQGTSSVGMGGPGGMAGGPPAGGPPVGGPPVGGPPAGGPPVGGPPVGGPPVGGPPQGGPPAGGPPDGAMGGPGGFGGPGMEAEIDNPIWVESTIEFEGDIWTNVGIRFKGNSSLRDSWGSGDLKMPLKLDFDEFEDEYVEIDDQRFYGFKQLSLSSNYRDDSYLRETLAYDVFDEMGIATPETALYEVYVDYGEGPVYFGLYTMVEVVDDTVIETNFEDDSGNVYKPDGLGSSFAQGSFNEDDFDKETNQDEADYSDILALYDALHSDLRLTDASTWRAELEAVFDVDTFLRWLATNTVIQNWDTYGVAYHNYYLYTNPSTGQLTWIPWDNNESMKSGDGMRAPLSLSLDEVGDDWPLISYLMADEVYAQQYETYVEQVTVSAFSVETMERTIQELAELIRPYVANESDTATFDAAIADLIQHVSDRTAAVDSFLAQ